MISPPSVGLLLRLDSATASKMVTVKTGGGGGDFEQDGEHDRYGGAATTKTINLGWEKLTGTLLFGCMENHSLC